MAEKITMPRLSDTMEEGTVAKWLKKEGDKVEEGDILAEIETDKATMEFESFYSGTLLKIGVGEGESAAVDTMLAIIGPKGTDVSGIAENFKKSGKSSNKKENTSEDKKEEKEEKETLDNDSKKESLSTKVSENEGSSSAKASENEGKSESSQTTNEGRIFVSPLAKKLAEE